MGVRISHPATLIELKWFDTRQRCRSVARRSAGGNEPGITRRKVVAPVVSRFACRARPPTSGSTVLFGTQEPGLQVDVNGSLEQKLAHILDMIDSDIVPQHNLVAELKALASYPVTVALLSKTRAGVQLAKLSKSHPDLEVREAAMSTSAAWRTTISADQLGHYLQQRGNVSVPSSSCAGLLPMYAGKS